MIDFVIVLVLGVIVGAAGGYVYRTKKRGAKCIGCPVAGGCSGKCSCHSED